MVVVHEAIAIEIYVHHRVDAEAKMTFMEFVASRGWQWKSFPLVGNIEGGHFEGEQP